MQPHEIERIPPPPPPKQKATAPALPPGLVFVVLTLLALLVQKYCFPGTKVRLLPCCLLD